MTCPGHPQHITRNMLRVTNACRPASVSANPRQQSGHQHRPWGRQRRSSQPQTRPSAPCRHLGHPGRPVARQAGTPDLPDLPAPDQIQLPPAKGPLLFNSFPSISTLESIAGVDDASAGEQQVPSQDGSTGPGPSGPPEKGMAHRWKVTWAMAIAFILCNLDKVNMSVAIIPMAEELGWKAADRGIASAAFFWGYTLTQIPAGILSTRLGGAKVLLAGVALWSVGTLFAPPAAHISLFALCATRAFVGLGEGLAPSSATNVMARLIPERERSQAVTTVFGSLDVGSAIGLLACPPLIRMFGWSSVFSIFAIIGLVWCAIWPTLNPERTDVASPPPPPPPPSQQAGRTKVPWGIFLRSRPVWAIICAHFCFNWGYYTLLAWLPSFFQLALHLDVETSSLLTLVPYIAMSVMTPFVGKAADGLVNKGWEMTNVRKLAQGVAFAGPAACMLTCGMLTPAAVSSQLITGTLVVLLSVAFACGSWARAGLYCNGQDLSPKYAGALLGLSNTFGAVPGALGTTSVGFLLDYFHDWGIALFYPTAFFQLFGLTIYTLYASSKRQDWA